MYFNLHHILRLFGSKMGNYTYFPRFHTHFYSFIPTYINIVIFLNYTFYYFNHTLMLVSYLTS